MLGVAGGGRVEVVAAVVDDVVVGADVDVLDEVVDEEVAEVAVDEGVVDGGGGEGGGDGGTVLAAVGGCEVPGVATSGALGPGREVAVPAVPPQATASKASGS